MVMMPNEVDLDRYKFTEESRSREWDGLKYELGDAIDDLVCDSQYAKSSFEVRQVYIKRIVDRIVALISF